METTQDYVIVSLKLLGALGLLIYGMRMMSDALQKMAGPQLRYILAKMTTNRLTGMLTGTFCNLRRAVIVGHHRYDSIVCVGRTADAGTGHISDYGCQHRYDLDGVDHVVGV